jgi:NTE family protein
MSFASWRGRIAAFGCGLCVILAIHCSPAGADEGPAGSDNSAPRPRVGLVLAGGGAKGGAHVGVLKVLEELHVPVDCIAGTSMGALVGAGYAAGMPAADLETFLTGVDWEAVVGGIGRRPLEPIAQKLLVMAASSGVDLGVRDGQIITPSGLTNTSGIDNLLRTYVARARMIPDFDRLPIPYRAVATDMVTGRMVVLDHGDLALAMRASMAIPGAFAPVVWDKYILADGGQVRNIPVDVAREACAEVVIVVNLVEPETPPEKLVEATQLLARSMDVVLEANENRQLESLTARDVRVDVQMGDIGTADFMRVPETIPLGEAAARKVADRLAAYAVPEREYIAWRDRVTTRQEVEARVASVRFEGLERVNPEYLRSLTSIKPGDTVDIEAIGGDAMRMSALNDVDAVAYRLEGDAANPTLVWWPEEASIGPNVLRPSLGIFASGRGDMKFVLGVQYVRHWLNERGGQWINNVQVGYEAVLSSSLYQPFDVAQRFFVEPGVFASRTNEDLYVDTERVAEYRFTDLGSEIDLGVNLGQASQLRVGYVNTRRKALVQTGVATLPEIGVRFEDADTRDAGIAASAIYDSRERESFARHGMAAAVQYFQSDESMGADRNWNRIEAGLRKGLPFGRNALWVSLAGGTHFGDDELPGDRAFTLGGPRTMPAYQVDELRADEYWLADVNILWRIADLLTVRDQAIYAGVGLQAAGLYDRVDLVPDGEIYSASLSIGGPTPVGTLTLGVAGSEDSWGFWLSLGRPVGSGSILNDGLFR